MSFLLGEPQERQAVITLVVPNGPADLAKLVPGHIVHTINDRDIYSRSDFVRACKGCRPGDELILVVDTGDETKETFVLTVQAKEITLKDVTALVRISKGNTEPNDRQIITDIHSRLKYLKTSTPTVGSPEAASKRSEISENNTPRYLWHTSAHNERIKAIQNKEAPREEEEPFGPYEAFITSDKAGKR